MKKIYLLAMGVVFSMGAIAQGGNLNGARKREFTRDEISKSVTPRQERATTSAMRVELLNENFEGVGGPYPSSALPTGWSSAIVADADGADTQSFLIHTSATANAGGYWPVAETSSGTANRFVGANDDNVPCDCNNLDTWVQTPELDFSTATNTAIQFDIFNNGTFGGGDGTLLFSVDGGNTFTILPYSADGDVLPIDVLWQTITLPIFDLAGQSSVIFRFAWSDAGSWASGFGVDNVVIGELQPNNLKVDKTVYGDWNQEAFGAGVWNYTLTPLAQASPLKISGVVANNGFNDQPNTRFTATLTMNGMPVGDPINSAQTSALLLSLDKDTLSVTSAYTPDALGTVVATISAASDSVETSPNDNVGAASMEMTQFVYGRDNNGAESFSGPGVAYEYGNLFDIYANQTFYAIQVAIAPERDAAGNDLSAGTSIVGRIYEWTGIDGTTGDPLLSDPLFETQEVTVNEAMYNAAGDAVFTNLLFPPNAVATLEAGKTYLATFTCAGDVRLANSGNNVWVSSWFFDSANGWGATSSVPMVRLTADPNATASVAENAQLASNGFSLGQNTPNPADESTMIAYNMPSAERVNIVVRDITGRIIMQQNEGLRQAGQNFARISVDALPAGVYTYTVNAGAVSATRQMVVR